MQLKFLSTVLLYAHTMPILISLECFYRTKTLKRADAWENCFLNAVYVNSRIRSTWDILAMLCMQITFCKQLNAPINIVGVWDEKEQVLRE